jgi:amino acid transporter
MGSRTLHRTLTGVEYFTFGFGTMVGVGWVVLMDDWLARGGPMGAVVAFLVGGLLLVPVALTYGRLVQAIPDAGAEIAYAETVFPPSLAVFSGWTMALAYAIVCPWEAVAAGNLLARVFPDLSTYPMYVVAGKTIFAPRLLVGLGLTALVAGINYRGVRLSGQFQNATTLGLLLLFGAFTLAGFARGDAANVPPLFATPGVAGAALSTLLMLQVVPYFMTGFESVGKGSEEAREDLDARRFGHAILGALAAGVVFYVTIVSVVAYIHPWKALVEGGLGTEAAFERAFGSRTLANVVVLAAFLSLLKIFNGNFLASTRLAFALGRRGLVHAALAVVHNEHGTPSVAIALIAALTATASFLGDAVLVPISEVGSLASGAGWLSACAAYLLRAKRVGNSAGVATAWAGVAVSMGIILMKVVPGIPGSFTWAEWTAFGAWTGLGFVFWRMRRPPS